MEGSADISGNKSYDLLLDYEPTNTSAPEEGGTGATVTGGSWKDADGNSYSGTVDSSDAGYARSLKNGQKAASAAPADGTDEPLDDDTMTGAEFVDYIWQHEGRPKSGPSAAADAPDQEHASAIAWAQSIGLIDDGLQLDELLTVADARIILTRLAAWKGIEMPELAALTGKESDPVLNCAEVLKEFFGED
ncbi:MAG: hypothetical protein HDT33_02545 [Clostridiales bacterium]|nr:hypothetical protein [Clostridiales bacterium]